MRLKSSLPSSKKPVILFNKMSHTTMVTAVIARWHCSLCRVHSGLTESTVGAVSQSGRSVEGIISVCAGDRTDTELCQHLFPWDDVISREKYDNLFLYNEWLSMCRQCCCQQEGTATGRN